jgi:hypothetical protein
MDGECDWLGRTKAAHRADRGGQQWRVPRLARSPPFPCPTRGRRHVASWLGRLIGAPTRVWSPDRCGGHPSPSQWFSPSTEGSHQAQLGLRSPFAVCGIACLHSIISLAVWQGACGEPDDTSITDHPPPASSDRWWMAAPCRTEHGAMRVAVLARVQKRRRVHAGAGTADLTTGGSVV